MRIVAASIGMVLGMAMLLSAMTAPIAVAQVASPSPSSSVAPSASASPSQSVEPSGSPLPDAEITLVPSTETIPSRSWAIAVSGGNASVDVLEVEDSGSSFSVTVLGQTASVTTTLILPPDLVLDAECFDFDNQMTIGVVEPPNQLVLAVAQGGTYECRYGSECAGPSEPPLAYVALYVSIDGFDVSRPWAISVTDGSAVSFGCSPRRISTVTLEPDPEIPDTLFGAFRVELFGDSATVDITAARPRGGEALVAAHCEDQDSDGLLRDVLVPPRRLVFDVVPMGFHICYVQGRPGTVPPAATVPPTDTPAERLPDGPSGLPTVIALLAAVFASSLVLGLRARRRN